LYDYNKTKKTRKRFRAMENNRSSATRPPVSSSSLFSQTKQISQNQQQQSRSADGSLRQASRSDTLTKQNDTNDTSGSKNVKSRGSGQSESEAQASTSKIAEQAKSSNKEDSETTKSKAPMFDPKDDVSGTINVFEQE